MRPSRRTLYGVALVCFANLLLEATLTRIFSATMFYHFTFLAIALALFGVGASGVYVYVRADRYSEENLAAEMAKNARRFAGTCVLAVVYVLANPMDIVFVSGTSQVPLFSKQVLIQLVLLVGFCSLPFFFAGMVVALAVTWFRQDISRVYSYDLAGAALGALLAGVLLGLLGGPSLVIFIAVLAVGAACLFEMPRGFGWAPAAGTAALLVFNLWSGVIGVPTVKGVKANKVVYEGWNVFSRVTVDDAHVIKIDASAATEIARTSQASKPPPPREITSLAHNLFPAGANNVMIIGAGGGRDVAHALGAGAKHVTGVEINPLIADKVMKHRFRDASESLYFDPRVNVVVADGRSFVRRSHDHYDVIQASLVDTWAATAAGAFSLTENTLYTIEAFEDYLDHLTPQGVVTMTRWNSGGHGETARLLILAAGALEKRGVPAGQTRRHIFYAASDTLGTLILAAQPLNDEDVTRLEAACQAGGFKILVSPRGDGTGELERFIDAGAWSPTVRHAHEDLVPPTDDRPFFFYFDKPAELTRWKNRLNGKGKMNDPTLWLLVSLVMVTLLTVSFIVLPLAGRGAPILRSGAVGRRSLILGYFALLGLAFIIVEIALLQKLTLFLGHPSYALLVVLFAILLATSAGARLVGRIPETHIGRFLLASGAALALITALYARILGPWLRDLVGWPIALRVLFAVLLVGIPGVLMGTMLPSGVRLASRRDAEMVPWGWGLNGATSVIGTVGATIVAIHAGFSTTLLAGSVGYALAAAGGMLLERLSRPAGN